ncbi:hypothetical protein WG66_004482, partial [Moniliophthora roreri]
QNTLPSNLSILHNINYGVYSSHASELHNLTSDSDSIMLHLPSHEIYFTGTSIFMGSWLVFLLQSNYQC